MLLQMENIDMHAPRSVYDWTLHLLNTQHSQRISNADNDLMPTVKTKHQPFNTNRFLIFKAVITATATSTSTKTTDKAGAGRFKSSPLVAVMTEPCNNTLGRL